MNSKFCTQCNGSLRHAKKCIVRQLELATIRIKALETQVKILTADMREAERDIHPMRDL
jgi:hypothetical protein